jgi:pyruvate carboxylase
MLRARVLICRSDRRRLRSLSRGGVELHNVHRWGKLKRPSRFMSSKVQASRVAAIASHLHPREATEKVLIANRGEIAVRIARAVATSAPRLRSVAVYPVDDATCLHVVRCDEKVELPGRGAAAYLDIDAIVRAAKQVGAHYIAPGYGFLRSVYRGAHDPWPSLTCRPLSENSEFAHRCEQDGLVFVGPTPEQLAQFGDS